MTAPTPEQMRALANRTQRLTSYEYELRAALRAAADQLEAVQDRERIDRAVTPVLVNASNYPSAVVPHLLGQDSGPLRRKVTEAVLAALTADTAPQEDRDE